MKKYFSERNLVILLFIAALILFSFAQEDSRQLEQKSADNGSTSNSTSELVP